MTTQHLVEVYETPGWIDDGFRAGWSLSSGAGTFTNAGTIAGDYAIMTPTGECAFTKSVLGSLSTNTYPVARIRVKGSSANAECAMIVWFTDSSYSMLPYFTPGTSWVTSNLSLTAGKTISSIQLWTRTATVDWDYVIILKSAPLVLEDVIEDLEVDLQTTIGVSGFKLRLLNDPSISAAKVGDIVMIYLAGDSETLNEKIIKGRIIDRVRSGEPDNPILEVIGESMEELLLERTYTDEFASAIQISAIAQDIIDDVFPEFTRSSIDGTNLTIKNRFDEERAYELLKKLAETAQYSDGTKGANFWVDPGDDLHFEKLCKWSGPDLTDGSDGGTKNILDITVKETMKSSPKVANDLKLIIFEAEHEPKNQDSWTDVESGLTEFPNWEVECTTPANVTIQPNYTDVKSGNASVEYHITDNPGNYIEMRCTLPTPVDISTLTNLKFWLKRTSGIIVDANGLSIYIETKNSWFGAYYELENLTPPGSDTWTEENPSISSFTAVGNPGKWATRVNIRLNSASGIGAGDIRIDKLRFERAEKAYVASDSTSQSRYGKRKKVAVDKSITDGGYAQYVVNGMLEHRKNHTTQVSVTTKGKAQVGFRPPQKVKLTSTKDGFNGAYFQIVSAKHRYVPQDIYTCELELITAVKPDATYEPKIVPQAPSHDLGSLMARLEEDDHLQDLAHRRREWQ